MADYMLSLRVSLDFLSDRRKQNLQISHKFAKENEPGKHTPKKTDKQVKKRATKQTHDRSYLCEKTRLCLLKKWKSHTDQRNPHTDQSPRKH
jgi:hypothetical protein